VDDAADTTAHWREAARERYLSETVRTWLGLPAHAGIETPRLPDELARRLLREEELEHTHRDARGRWEFGFCESFGAGTLLVPEVDQWVAERRRKLPEGTPVEPLWPEGKRFALCLTHDVDYVSAQYTLAQATRLVRAGLGPTSGASHDRIRRAARIPWRAFQAAVAGISLAPSAADLERCIKIEADAGVRSSYLFTVFPRRGATPQDCAYRPSDPCSFRGSRRRLADVLRLLAGEGFDVGLHGSYRSAVASGMLAAQRAELERAISRPVTTTRQHYLHWDVRVTPRLQERAGLHTDSTLGFNRSLGFRCGTSLPFHHFDVETSQPLRLIQVPLVIHDVALFRPDTLELDAGLAERLVCEVIDAVAAVGCVATLSFHPNYIGQPAFQSVYRTAIEHGLGRGGWATSLREIDEWWRERETRLAVDLPGASESVSGAAVRA